MVTKARTILLTLVLLVAPSVVVMAQTQSAQDGFVPLAPGKAYR